MRWVYLGIALLGALLTLPGLLMAQNPQQATVSALPPPLYVRIAGPVGMKVTVYRGAANEKSFDTPCVIAFRPGYRYRIELGNLPDRLRPQALVGAPSAGTVCPTLDVIGTLRLANGVRAAEHPVSLVFSDDDLATVRTGAVVTKVAVLERPEIAEPIATLPDRPLEITVPPYHNPMIEAQQRGRPLLILQMGERQASPQELVAMAVPGTVLLPGEKVMPEPRVPPALPWACYPLVDPVSGLPCACDEICFHDGGDGGLQAGIGPGGKLVGLDASDTVAQWFDSHGKQKIAVSNKVCLCVPRYVLIRTAITTAANTVGTAPVDANAILTPAKAQCNSFPITYQQELIARNILAAQKASGVINVQQVQAIGQMEGIVVYARAEGPGSITSACPEPHLAECEKLVIIKWPEKCDAQIGEAVTFFIRYKNQGQRPITGIVVSDSLTARLEYVPNSARSDRDALFTTAPNEVDSSVLRWEITTPLPPGQTGTVTFQAKVR
jgi:uncharacterized repeat protein (TIGR01451 family)